MFILHHFHILTFECDYSQTDCAHHQAKYKSNNPNYGNPITLAMKY